MVMPLYTGIAIVGAILFGPNGMTAADAVGAMESLWPLRLGVAAMTMVCGQWDAALAAAYSSGWVLLELDRAERVVAAYQRPDAATN